MPTVGRADVKIVADARGFARDVQREVENELKNVNVSAGGRSVARTFNDGVKTTVKRDTRGSFREAAIAGITSFGIVLQGGISRTAAGGFGVALLALLVPIMAAAGAVAAGALVLGFGAAFTAIPLIVAAQNKKVQKEMERFAKQTKKLFRGLSQPFEQVWFDILDTARRVLAGFAPTLETAFAGLAPTISTFVDQLGSAFLALEPAIQPMLDAFGTLLEEIGPILVEEVFPDLADALINLAEAVSENPEMLADMLTSLLQLPEALINFIAELTRLANWFNENPELIILALGFILAAMIALGGPISLVIGAILALGAVILFFKDEVIAAFKLIGEKIGEIWQAFLDWLSDLGRKIQVWVQVQVNKFQALMNGIGQVFDNIGKFLSDLGGDIRDGFNDIVAFVGSIPGRIASAASGMWDSIVSTFKDAINGIIGAWNGLSFTVPAISAFGKTIGGGTIGTPNIPFLQEGGVITQAGAAIVGEAGPEAVFLDRGAVVQPLPEPDREVGELPAEFEATAIIDLGEGIQERMNLTFKQIKSRATARPGRV